MSTCRVTPGCTNPVENEDTGACASCGAAMRKAERIATATIKKGIEKAKAMYSQKQKTPIKKVSDKMSTLLAQYSKEKKQWIKGKYCVIYPERPVTEIHHKKGRVGYADEWARQNDIPLLLDKRYWLPVSADAHRLIEENRAWAEEQGFTLSRSEKI